MLFANDAAKRVFRDSAAGQIAGGKLVLGALSVTELISGVKTLEAYVAAVP